MHAGDRCDDLLPRQISRPAHESRPLFCLELATMQAAGSADMHSRLVTGFPEEESTSATKKNHIGNLAMSREK
jgi:hypothetical protein